MNLFKTNLSLAPKLIGGLLVIVVVGVAAGTFGMTSVLERALEEEIGKETSIFAESAIRDIDRIIFHRIESLQIYSRDLAEEPILHASNEAFAAFDDEEERAAYIATQDAAWVAAAGSAHRFADALTENELSKEIDEEFVLRGFYQEKYGHQLFNEVFVTNRYGATVAQVMRPSDYYQADEVWWQVAVAEGLYVGDVAFDESAGSFSIELAVRIESLEGEFLGVVKALLNIDDLIAVAEEIAVLQRTFGASAHLELITKDGRAIYSSIGESDFLEDISGDLVWQRIGAHVQGMPTYFQAPGDEEGEEEEFFVFARSEGYRNFSGLGWVMLLEQEVDELFRPVRDAMITVIVSTVVFLLILALVSSWFLNRSIIMPVRKLTAVAERITGGDLTARAPVRSHDELGKLGSAFNVMTAKLHDYQQSLEKKVKERTAKLKRSETKTRALLKSVQANEARLAAILASIGDGVFVVDMQHVIQVINPVAAQLAGTTVEAALGKPYKEVFSFTHEKDGKENDAFIVDAIDTGTTQEMVNHTLLITKNGTKIPVADSAAPLKDGKGAVQGCVVVFRDVTKEHAVDKAKSEFVSLASHQLRTPLAAINWNLEMLREDAASHLSKAHTQMLDDLYHSSTRMAQLVTSLLNVSRMELGTFSVEPERVDVVALTKNIVKDLAPRIKEKDITLIRQYSAKSLVMEVDVQLMRMIIENLVSNAVKYTPPKKSIEVTLATKGKHLWITVRDEGYGIPKGQQSRIFTRFFRADNVRLKETEGTGLGLYLAKSIVEHAGGKIWFVSEEHKGTTFHVTLPLGGMRQKAGTRKVA